jgi:tRNA threonylcarbamoyladenosine biosynthesis protein TsaB
MLLAIDTSTSYASLALADGERLVAELTWHAGMRHSSDLFARLTQLFETYDVAPARDLTAIAVATGPGSFNGIRVALTAAKSFAFALGLPLYGLPTLDVIAWGASFAEGTVWAVLEAGRGQLYAAAYDTPGTDAAAWAPRAGYEIVTPTELATHVTQPVVFCGEWREATREVLEQTLGERARFAATLTSGRATWLAQLAQGRAAAGRADQPAALEPLYLRRPAITSSAKTSAPPSEARAADDHPAHEQTSGGEGAARAIHD